VAAVRAQGWTATGLATVALIWGGAGYLLTRPTDFHEYRVTAVGSAQSAYNALATARLTGQALENGRVTTPYAQSVYDDAREALAGAAKEFAAVSPPDDRTTALRDELAPLLTGASTALTDIEDGQPGAGEQVADALHDFVDEHK
jgi:hypothetical protein